MSALDEEYYHNNMYSWEDLVSECIGLEDTVTQLRSENTRLQKAVDELLDFAAEGWAYASDYFKEKWNFEGEYKRLKEYGSKEAI